MFLVTNQSPIPLNPPKFSPFPLSTPQITHFAPFPTPSNPIHGISKPLIFNAKSSKKPFRICSSSGENEVGEEEMEKFDEEELDGPKERFKQKVEDEIDYDRDPEFADILGSSLDEPEKARKKVEERVRKKRNKILHTKTGSATPMQVTFNKFDFTNSHIWFEFYNAPLEKDVTLICDAIRSWHIVGRLGGCNSMNMQLSQSDFEKRPSYDCVQGSSIDPTTFFNVGDLEVQDNLARIWLDIGVREPLLLDILINALIQISSDYVGIKQVVFGGSEFETWKENMSTDDPCYSVHKI
ncbi:hypothetical protein AKJ16_DCAP09624 [Drosera capensis]